MRTGRTVLLGASALALGAAALCCAQSPAHPSAQALLSSGALVPVSVQPESIARGEFAPGDLVREIDDPHTGDRWLLVRNDLYPGGPGRLVLVAGVQRVSAALPPRSGNALEDSRSVPVIRAGDRLIVEEHTRVVDAVLEARALAPAVRGAQLEVRLTIGGRVVRAVALGPGRATLVDGTGARP